jgi:hypothetical protein
MFHRHPGRFADQTAMARSAKTNGRKRPGTNNTCRTDNDTTARTDQLLISAKLLNAWIHEKKDPVSRFILPLDAYT